MKTLNFIYRGKPTNFLYLVKAGLTPEGATVSRRKKGYSDFKDIQALITAGILEPRKVGPRGGIRYFTTPAGTEAMKLSFFTYDPFCWRNVGTVI